MFSANFIQQTICKLTRDLRARAAGIRRNKETESVHQMRVNSRRLRNALLVFKDFSPKKDRKTWEKEIRALTTVLGQARDLDVKINFIQELSHRTDALPYRKGLDSLHRILVECREEVQPELLKALVKWQKAKVLFKIEQAFKKSSPMSPTEFKTRLINLGKKRITKKIKALVMRGKYARQTNNTARLHKLRIAAKNLRYTLETLQPVYGPSLNIFINDVYVIQSTLGRMRDYDNWILSLQHLIPRRYKEDEDIQQTLSFLQKECRRLRAENYQAFSQHWQKINKQKIRTRLQRLSTSIADPGSASTLDQRLAQIRRRNK